MTCHTCPKCGYDLERLELLKIGDLEIHGGAEIRWKGQRVELSASRSLIVIALARAGGAWVAPSTLADVVDYDGDNPTGLIGVHTYWIRKAFKAIDPSFDRIERVQGRGATGEARWRIDKADRRDAGLHQSPHDDIAIPA